MLNARAVGRLIATIGHENFEGAFFKLANSSLKISSCSAFCFKPQQEPMPVILEGGHDALRDLTKALGTQYVKGGFRSDPQIRDLFDVTDIEVRVVDPSGIDDSQFRGAFYDQPQIGFELNVLAHYRRKYFSISFYRNVGDEPFDAKAIKNAKELARVITPALARHVDSLVLNPEWLDAAEAPTHQPPAIESDDEWLDHLSAVLLAEGHGLSPREAQVCAAIILGYRTLAISLQLGISENTICTHRKRAYAKLGICSQNELFSRYFRTIARLKARTPTRQHAAPVRAA